MDTARSLVSVEHKFVLWWHQKAACTTLRAWFAQVLGHEVDWTFGPQVNGRSIHALPMPIYAPKQHGGYYHFTVVRNPRARLVSHYRQQIVQPGYTTNGERTHHQQAYSSFRDFVGIVCTTPPERLDQHVAPQWPVVEGVKLDAVVHLEQMEAEWAPVVAKLGVDHIPLRPVNLHRYTEPVECCADWRPEQFLDEGLRPPWECYYDDTLLAITQIPFAEDLERWYS